MKRGEKKPREGKERIPRQCEGRGVKKVDPRKKGEEKKSQRE